MILTKLSPTCRAIVCTSTYLARQPTAPNHPLLFSGGLSKGPATIASGPVDSDNIRIILLQLQDRRIREAIQAAEEELEKIRKDAEEREYRAGVQAQLDGLDAQINSTQARINSTQSIVHMLVQRTSFPITCQILQKNVQRKKLGSPIFKVHQKADSNLEELNSWNHFEDLDNGDLGYLGETKEEQEETMRFAAQILAFGDEEVHRASHLELASDISIVYERAVNSEDSTLLRQATYVAKMYARLLGHDYTEASLFLHPSTSPQSRLYLTLDSSSTLFSSLHFSRLRLYADTPLTATLTLALTSFTHLCLYP